MTGLEFAAAIGSWADVLPFLLRVLGLGWFAGFVAIAVAAFVRSR